MGFGTTTGKVELYSTTFEKLGYDPLPQYREPTETTLSNPELAKEYPLTLITGGRFNPQYHSEFRQIEFARRLHPNPLMQIHPETAKSLEIEEGDWVWIESPRGRIKQKADLFAGMDPRLVVVQVSWCYWEKSGPERLFESNANVLTGDEGPFDPGTGSPNVRALLCKIYKVEENDGQ